MNVVKNFQGLTYHHEKTNIILERAIDDCVQDLNTKELFCCRL